MTSFQLKEMQIVRQTVADQFGVTVRLLNVRNRSEPLATIRHVAMFLCAELTGSSRPMIGCVFNRDQSNVTHSIKAIRAVCEPEHHWRRTDEASNVRR